MAVSSADKIYLSDEDQKKLAQYTAQWEEANKNNDEVGKRAAHDAAEKLRSNASVSYSGGSNGSGYTPNTTKESFSYESAPSYVSKYADQIDSLYNAIVNRDAFSYDYTTDPLWSQYKKQYTREGQRATADTLGQYATMTGGMPSTAAVTAAQQAGDYYNAQMTDKIPELQQLAYSMYQNEGNDMYNQLNALQTMENNNYNRYLDDVNQYNTNRNYQYNLERDAIEDARYEDELAYQRAQDQKEWNYKLAQAAAKKKTGSDRSEDFDTIAKVAEGKGYSGAQKYLERQVDDGNITEDEAYYIYTTLLGYTPASEYESAISEGEFNRSTAMQKKWGSYSNYLANYKK